MTSYVVNERSEKDDTTKKKKNMNPNNGINSYSMN